MNYNINNQSVQTAFQAIPMKMKLSHSINYYLAESLFNIAKYQNRPFLNILITNTQFLQLINKAIDICHIGISGLTPQQKYLISMYYNNMLIVSQDINNSYIDVIISDNKELTEKVIKNNFVKYVYAFHDLTQSTTYKKYKASITNCFLYINRLSPKNYQNKEIKSNIIQKKQQKQQKQQKQKIILKKQITKIQPKLISKKQYQFIENTVTFIIPFYNNETYTINFIKMVQKYTEQTNYKINFIFINDCSNQKSIQNFQLELKKYNKFSTQILHNQNHYGYVISTNKGIKKALENKTQYIILAHNDTQVSYNWQNILNNLSENIAANCPIAGSKVDNYQTVENIRKNNILENFPQSFQKCKTLTINNKLEIYNNISKDLPQAPSFFFIAFQAKVFNQIGLLNQKFKDGFGESIEFYYRCLNNNYKFNLIPSVYIPHIGMLTYRDIYPDKSFIQQARAKYYINEIRQKLNYNKIKNKVIYTCVTNNYDFIKHSYYNTQDFDYVYFGETPINDPNWIFIDISKIIPILGIKDNIKISRFFKTHPHIFFKNYEMSLWIDGNIDIIDDPIDICNLLYDEDYMLISKHPQRDSVYSQVQVCKAMNKDKIENINKLIQYLKQNGFKDSTGLVQSGLIVRKHNNKQCIELMQNWWKLIKEFSCRDQLSFNYCIQKLHANILIIEWNNFQNKYIQWNGKHGLNNGNNN